MKFRFKISLKRFGTLFLVLSLIFTSTGCVTNTESPPGIPSVTLTPSPTITITPSPSPSQTTVPPTQTPVTPMPTLPPEQKETYWLNLIETNGGCQLPCFAGIQPGISTWEEIRKVEGPLHFREQYVPDDKGSIFLSTYLGKENRVLDVTFGGSGNVVERINVKARVHLTEEPVDYFPEFSKVMYEYYIPNILGEFGTPSRILLYVHGNFEPDSGTAADIYLFYDEDGILVNYFFEGVVVQKPNTGVLNTCLDFEHLTFITLYLQSSFDTTPLERAAWKETYDYMSEIVRPLEEITPLSVEDFYNLLMNTNQVACFEVL